MKLMSYLDNNRNIFRALALTFLISLFFRKAAVAQEVKLEYNVKHGKEIIGSVVVLKNTINNRTSIKLSSNIKAGSIISFKIVEKAEAWFENGDMVFSTIFREVNGSEKVNKIHKLANKGYIIEAGTKKDSVCCFRITYNLLSMFLQEPVNIASVYSDNFQQFIKIKNLGSQQYRLDFPNGIYQKYYYSNGLLVKQEIHNTFYTAVMELAKR